MHTAKRKGVLCFLTVLAITGAYKSAFAACTRPYPLLVPEFIRCTGTGGSALGDLGVDNYIVVSPSAVVINVEGEWSNVLNAQGGDDTIDVGDNTVITGFVRGETLVGNGSTGGKDSIIISTNAHIYGSVLGDFIRGDDTTPGNIITGGGDNIYVNEATVDGWVMGDSLVFKPDDILNPQPGNFSAVGGDDEITVYNGSTVGWVVGERITGSNSIGGSDTITITDSTVTDSVVGDYFVDGVNNISSNHNRAATNFITITGSTIGNRVAGSMFVGDYNVAALETLTLDSSSAREVDGTYAVGDYNIAAPTTIIIRNGSSVSDYVFGELMVGDSNVGANNNISITDSLAGVVVGSGMLGGGNAGGNATITVSNSTVDAVVGDLFQYGDNNKAGNDTINVVSGSTVNNGVYGDYFDGGSGHVAGNDTITINNATVNGDIYGEYYGSGATEATPGDDTINLTNARVNGSIYGGNGSDTVNYNGNGNAVSGIIDGGDDVGTADGYIDTLNINGYSGAAFNNYVNFEDVNLVGATLDYGSNFASPESLNYNIDSNSALILTGGGSGVYEINSSVNNSGLMDFRDGTVGDHLDITGNFDSTSGVYLIDVDFNSRQADSITVGGEFTGSGTIEVNPLYVTSAASSDAQEIIVVEAPNDTSHGDENFVYVPSQRYNNSPYLARFNESPFIWQLRDSNGNLVLGYVVPSDETGKALPEAEALMPEPKQTVIPEIPAYVSLPTFGREVVMNELDTMHQRMGELRNHLGWVGTDGSVQHPNEYYNSKIDFDESKVNGWARGTASHFDFSEGSSFDVDGNYMSVDLGFDKRFKLSEDKSLFFGGFYGQSTGDFDNNSRGEIYQGFSPAQTDIDAWSLGAYATFFNTSGTYVDVVGEYMDMEADIKAIDHYSTDGSMLGGSVEVGHSIGVKENWVVEPQAQVKLAYVTWDGFYDGYNDVSFADHTYVTGRLGVRTQYTFNFDKEDEQAAGQASVPATRKDGEVKSGKELQPWVYAGVLHEFTDAPDIHYIIDFASHQYDTAGQLMGGVTFDLAERVQLYGDVSYIFDFSDYEAIRGDVGLRVHW